MPMRTWSVWLLRKPQIISRFQVKFYRRHTVLRLHPTCHKQQVPLVILLILFSSVCYQSLIVVVLYNDDMIPIPIDSYQIKLRYFCVLLLTRTFKIKMNNENLTRQVMNDEYLFWLMTFLIICWCIYKIRVL